MADTWDTTEIQAALPDQTSDGAAPVAPAAEPSKNPQEYGWVEPTKYNYELYNKSSKEIAEDQANGLGLGGSNEDFGVGGVAVGEWASNAKVYTWNDDYGDVVPRFKELEKQLFGTENHVRSGIKFENISQIDVSQEGAIRIKPIKHFSDAGLHPVMMENIELAGYKVPTPIQQYTIPSVLQGHDLVACAQTGSGKTAAFLIPILSKLMGKAKKLCAPRPNPATFVSGQTPGVRAEPLVLIVAPCRELATQIFDEARRFCYRSMLRPAVVYGGGPIAEQILQLEKGCDILIGTPGRLCDFMSRPHLLTLHRLKYMVIDEADEMLDSGWSSQLNQLLSGGNQEQGIIEYFLFSATFPKMARELAIQHLAHNHVRIHVGRAGSSHVNIKQDIVFVEPHAKKQALLDLLLSAPPARTMIFVNSKRAADELDDFLFNNRIPCTSIHGDRTQREREDSIRAFRSGKTPVLIATGVSARGLDIHKVMHVINFDLPSSQYGGVEEYTHRIGRTGRIGNMGLATSFYDPRRDVEIADPLVKLMLETRQIIPDFLREHLPEGFTADDAGVVTGDYDGLKFEEADNEENADDGGGWGNEATAESTEAPAQVEASGFGDAAGQAFEAAPTKSAPTKAAPSLAASEFGAPQGPPAPPAQFTQQAPVQSSWGVPSAAVPAHAIPVAQGTPGYGAAQYNGAPSQYGGQSQAPSQYGGQSRAPSQHGGQAPSQYVGQAPRHNGQAPQFHGQGPVQYNGQYGQLAPGFGAPPQHQQHGAAPPQQTQYAPAQNYGPPSVQASAPATNGTNGQNWGAPAQNGAPRAAPTSVPAPPKPAPVSNGSWDANITW